MTKCGCSCGCTMMLYWDATREDEPCSLCAKGSHMATIMPGVYSGSGRVNICPVCNKIAPGGVLETCGDAHCAVFKKAHEKWIAATGRNLEHIDVRVPKHWLGKT